MFFKKYWQIITATLAFIALLLIATFFDLQISDALVDLEDGEYLSKNLFGIFFEIIGELPFYIGLGVASIILTVKLNSVKGKIKILGVIFFILGGIVSFYFVYQIIFEYLGEHLKFEHLLEGVIDDILYFIVGTATNFSLLLLFKKFSAKTIDKLVVFAFVVFITGVLSQILTAGLKSVAGRARYRMMHVLTTKGVEDGFSYYTPWYVFNGKRSVPELWKSLGIASNGFRSFPSGHTSCAAMTCVLLFLPTLFAKYSVKKYKITITLIAVLFPIIVAISRVVVGAHFLTDVLIGGAMTFVSYFIALLIIKVLKRKFKFLEINEL